MFKLVKTTKEMMVEELVRSLYKEDLFAEMLVEQEEVAAQQADSRQPPALCAFRFVRRPMAAVVLRYDSATLPRRWRCGVSTCRRWSSNSAKPVQFCKSCLPILSL
jgi:hypothetical protein